MGSCGVEGGGGGDGDGGGGCVGGDHLVTVIGGGGTGAGTGGGVIGVGGWALGVVLVVLVVFRWV